MEIWRLEMSGTIADLFLQKKKIILFLCTYLAVPYIKIKFSESLPSVCVGDRKNTSQVSNSSHVHVQAVSMQGHEGKAG